jgi:diadenosine tetraphosphate (Ap4A) HIT family hydrolase
MATPAERIAALERGEDPNVIVKLASGYLVASSEPYLPGYCLLLASPFAGSLEGLDAGPRTQFLDDLGRVGEVLKVVANAKRINYGIYGNVDPFLHAHLWPRYEWEDEPFSKMPPLGWPNERRVREAEVHAAAHAELVQRLRGALAV